MTSIGETLRRERLRRNLHLDQISRETKIASRMLEAIETEHFERLPGKVFAKSFVRQYARFLGLEEEELLAELDRTMSPPAPVLEGGKKPGPVQETSLPRVEIPLPRVEEWRSSGDSRFRWSSSLPAAALVVVVMLVCSAVYAWWQRSRMPKPAPPESTTVAAQNTPPAAPVPTAPAPVNPAPAPGPKSELAANPPEASATPPVTPPATPAAPAGEAPREATPAPPTAELSPPAVARVPQFAADPNAPVRVQLTASEPAWVRVTSDGKFVFSGTLQANETRTVGASEIVVVRTGNAGGIQVSLNGKPVGAAGPKGQARTLQFTSGGFQIVPPAAPKPPAVLADPL